MKIIFKTISILFLSITLFNCGGGSDDGPGEVEEVVLPPEASVQISPAKDEACNQGNVLSDTQSKVTFSWNAAANTESYKVDVKNLSNNQSKSATSSTTSAEITLDRGTSYSWTVTSKSTETTETATSETWEFYNAAAGVENHVPYPATIVSPVNESTTSSNVVTLEWTGSDADNDIAEYEVYLDTNNPPTALESTTTSQKIENKTLVANTKYYWKVHTKDASGNISITSVHEFTTK
jgi:hypothetical protein